MIPNLLISQNFRIFSRTVSIVFGRQNFGHQRSPGLMDFGFLIANFEWLQVCRPMDFDG